MLHTHKGICQICGRLQAVYNVSQLIAEHGYTTRHGWFEGSCVGSNEVPLNISSDFLKKVTENIEAEIEKLEKQFVEEEDVKARRAIQRRLMSGKSFVTDARKTLAAWKPFPMVDAKHVERERSERIATTKAEREAKRAAEAARKIEREAKRQASLIWTEDMPVKARAKAERIFTEIRSGKWNGIVGIFSKEEWVAKHCENIYDVEKWLEQKKNTGKIEVVRLVPDEMPGVYRIIKVR